jgi:transaldolase
MALYLDSAQIDDAKQAMAWGWVKGITTNPTLLAQSELSPAETLTALVQRCSGELYYQLTTSTLDDMVREGHRAAELIGSQTVLKIPATPLGFQALAQLSPQISCAVTGIYHPAQAMVASEGGAKYAIAYVNRATRLLGDGILLVAEMAQILRHSPTRILAASIKSPDEAAAAFQAGADHLTLPLDQLRALATHPLSDATVQEFAEKGRGLDIIAPRETLS